MAVRHAKVSAKADGGDSTVVRPSDWNADHVAFSSLAIGTAVSGNYEISRSSGETHDLTLTGAATATLAGASTATDEATDLRILLRQDGTGGRTMTWPGSISWVNGSAPTLGTAGDAVDTIGLLSTDGGTSWLGYYGDEFENPMTTAGDIIVGGASGVPTRLAKGTDGQSLTMASGSVAWATGGAFTAPVAPGQVAYVKASTNYTTTSDTFADVDGTNITITKTFAAARYARICVALTAQVSVATGAIGFDIDIDGTRLLNTTYGQVFNMGNTGAMPLSFCLITTSALSAASHTFKLQWRKVGSITATAWGSGVYPVTMSVEEMMS